MEQERTPGIIYLSQIPPFMQPRKIRHIFSKFGETGRIYLLPEEPMSRRRRKGRGGNKKQKFLEGWVEMKDKKVAKTIAMALNNTPVEAKKSKYFHDDLWNTKYLSKCQWSHLTEKIAYESAVRRQRRRMDTSSAKRESSAYMENVEEGKALEAIISRKKKRGICVEDAALRSHKQRKVGVGEPQPGHGVCDTLLRKVLPGMS